MCRHRLATALLALLFLLVPSVAQTNKRHDRTGRANPEAPASGAMPTPTFEGRLKVMTGKEITIQLQTEDQLLTIRRDHKTKFIENGKEIKPSKIAVGTPLAIDVRQDLDLSPIAVRVVVNPPPAKQDKGQNE